MTDIVSPFRDEFFFVRDVPWHAAQRLVDGLNERGAAHNEQPGAMHPSQGAADSIFHRYLGHAFVTYWAQILGLQPGKESVSPPPTTSGRPESARRLDELLIRLTTDTDLANDLPHLLNHSYEQMPSLGYVTADSCPGQGDDTVHIPIPYSDIQPEYVASQPVHIPTDERELVDVVFVDFIADPLLHLLNLYDTKRTYTMQDVDVWGDISTQSLYSTYAQLHWRPQSIQEAWEYMDRAATAEGYPPLAQYDAYEGNPYASVTVSEKTRGLVFQPSL